jgi:hypothetical protein
VRGYGATTVDVNGGFVSLTYRKITTAAPLQYQVEQSSDLLAWSNATTQDEVVSTRGNIQTIKAKVALGSNARMFLRLKITQTAGPVAAAKTTSRRGAYKTGSGR